MEVEQNWKKTRSAFGIEPKARAGWPKRLGLVQANPHAEVDVIGVYLCQIASAIFPIVALR